MQPFFSENKIIAIYLFYFGFFVKTNTNFLVATERERNFDGDFPLLDGTCAFVFSHL